MRVLGSKSFSVLKSISDQARHHLSLGSQQRREVRRLWMSRMVRLRKGDLWEISQIGRQWLRTDDTKH